MKSLIILVSSIVVLSLASCSSESEKIVTNVVYSDTERVVKDYTFYIPFNNNLFEKITSNTPIANSSITFTNDRNGISNNAVYLNGTQVLKYNSSDAINLFGHFSISCWVKPDLNYGFTSSDLQNEIQLLGRFTGVGEGISSYALNLLNDGRVSLRICNVAFVSTYYNTNTIIAPSTWNHIAATYDGATLKIYINGKLEFSQISYNFAQSANVEFCVGARNFPGIATNRFYKGAIDEIKIYRRAINLKEITELAK